LPCLVELYNLFIINGVKVIPAEGIIIYDLLTPLALAHWIQGDGFLRDKGVGLATDSYSIVDVVRLINVLQQLDMN